MFENCITRHAVVGACWEHIVPGLYRSHFRQLLWDWSEGHNDLGAGRVSPGQGPRAYRFKGDAIAPQPIAGTHSNVPLGRGPTSNCMQIQMLFTGQFVEI